jgi:hypothetical protein
VPNEGRRHGASIPAGLTEALQEVETAGDVLNEMKRFSGKLSDRVLPLRVDGGAGIASGGRSAGWRTRTPRNRNTFVGRLGPEAAFNRLLGPSVS